VSHVYLYSTPGCHLCEKAKSLLWPVLAYHGFRLVEKDIAEDDGLIDAYGVRIPVLVADDLSCELNWPFDEQQASDFLAALKR
jgi:glutaredoxin